MLLTFSRLDSAGEPTEFEAKIKAGVKRHTFRQGNRWKPGTVIHFWSGTPRNQKNNPYEFSLPEFTADYTRGTDDGSKAYPLVSIVEDFKMSFPETGHVLFQIGDLMVDENLLEIVAQADGFDSKEAFVAWFRRTAEKAKVKVITGQVIHWRGTAYAPDTAKEFNAE
jgi:hypothetical protein